MASSKKINIRLLIDKEKNKVLFAESDKDFVEALFCFLTLPISTIVSLANKQSNLGCIDALYRSVEALDKDHFQTEACKEMLLRPRSEAGRQYQSLDLDFDGTGATQGTPYYDCPSWTCCTETHCLTSMFENSKCLCGQKMSIMRPAGGKHIKDDRVNGVFVKGNGKYMVSDDLEVTTLSVDTSLSIFRQFGIKDGSNLEERNITFGMEEVKELLKRSILSKTPMSDVFLSKKTGIDSKFIKTESLESYSLSQADTKQVNLKILIRKSKNQVIYAVAKAEFMNTLFSLLTFPIGAVVKILGGYSSIGSMDKLYKSVESLCNEDPETYKKYREKLLDPRVAFQHGCKNQLLQIKEESGNVTITKCSKCFQDGIVVTNLCKHGLGITNLSIINPKVSDTVTEGGGGFIKESMAFMVTDDLVVQPHSQISSISHLNQHGVPFNDLEERSVTVGELEALSILKALLTCKTVLTSVFGRKH
ncbi:hypothetical protein ACHQM5_014806 [Ranunculus cassubicifolius]